MGITESKVTRGLAKMTFLPKNEIFAGKVGLKMSESKVGLVTMAGSKVLVTMARSKVGLVTMAGSRFW